MSKKHKRPEDKIDIRLNNHVMVRARRDCQLSNEDLKNINIAYTMAIKYIEIAIDEVLSLRADLSGLNSDSLIPENITEKHQGVIMALESCFGIKGKEFQVMSIDSFLEMIFTTLYKTGNGLLAEKKKLTISNKSNKPDVSSYAGYVNWYKKKRRIYIDFKLLNNFDDCFSINRDKFINTLIHEASHLFARTDDYDLYYQQILREPLRQYDLKDRALNYLVLRADKYFDDNEYKIKNYLAPFHRVHHAASISKFVFESARQSPLLGKVNQEALADRECNAQDVSRLFAPKQPTKIDSVTNKMASVTKWLNYASIFTLCVGASEAGGKVFMMSVCSYERSRRSGLS